MVASLATARPFAFDNIGDEGSQRADSSARIAGASPESIGVGLHHRAAFRAAGQPSHRAPIIGEGGEVDDQNASFRRVRRLGPGPQRAAGSLISHLAAILGRKGRPEWPRHSHSEFGRRHSNFARTSGGSRRARPASTTHNPDFRADKQFACRTTRCSSVSEAPPSSRAVGFDGQQVVHRRGLSKSMSIDRTTKTGRAERLEQRLLDRAEGNATSRCASFHEANKEAMNESGSCASAVDAAPGQD